MKYFMSIYALTYYIKNLVWPIFTNIRNSDSRPKVGLVVVKASIYSIYSKEY